MVSVFVSYSADCARAFRRLTPWLDILGVSVTGSDGGLGRSEWNRSSVAIRRSDWVIALWSKEYLAQPLRVYETRVAKDDSRLIGLPVEKLVARDFPQELADIAANYSATDFGDGSLMRHICAVLATAALAPRPAPVPTCLETIRGRIGPTDADSRQRAFALFRRTAARASPAAGSVLDVMRRSDTTYERFVDACTRGDSPELPPRTEPVKEADTQVAAPESPPPDNGPLCEVLHSLEEHTRMAEAVLVELMDRASRDYFISYPSSGCGSEAKVAAIVTELMRGATSGFSVTQDSSNLACIATLEIKKVAEEAARAMQIVHGTA
jgi:hypothetical protein